MTMRAHSRTLARVAGAVAGLILALAAVLPAAAFRGDLPPAPGPAPAPCVRCDFNSPAPPAPPSNEGPSRGGRAQSVGGLGLPHFHAS